LFSPFFFPPKKIALSSKQVDIYNSIKRFRKKERKRTYNNISSSAQKPPNWMESKTEIDIKAPVFFFPSPNKKGSPEQQQASSHIITRETEIVRLEKKEIRRTYNRIGSST